MDSEKKRRLQREKERLEELQNIEKRFMKNMYGDFFGKKPEDKKDSSPAAELKFGEKSDQDAEKGRKEADAKKSARGRTEGSRVDELEQKGREVADSLAARTDALIGRQKAVSSELQERKDALRRANDALREVQSLLDNPLYNGMPGLTGNGAAGTGPAGTPNVPDGFSGDEIDPSLMTGSDGDLFSGFAGTGSAAPNVPDASQGSGSAAGAVPRAATATAQTAQQPQEKKKEPEKDPMEELDALIGLAKIKHDVRELTDFVRIQKLRKDGGLKSVPVSLHLVFTGNPGTGKTTVARILAKLYKQIGVLSTGQLVEVDRSGLVAGYVGQTAIKTSKKIEEAKGGVLFIDEAYALARKDDTFGQEAIDTILKAMEDNREDFVVIVAGYTRPMENFINSNPGLKSRFNKYIEFPDYTIDELMGIFDMNCKKYDYEAEDDVKAQIRAMIVQRKMAELENFANAREVRNLFEEIITNQARRVARLEKPTKDDMKKILLEDLVETAEEDAEKTMKKASEKEAEKKSGEAADKDASKETGGIADKDAEKETGETADKDA